MKRILQALIAFTPFLATSQSIIHWEPEISVADGSVYGNIRPRIAVAANGVPIVLFGKGPAGLLYTARLNGSVFDTPVTLLPGTMESYLASWTGPDIAAKGDTVIAVFKAMTMDDGHVYSVRSVDGGLTFSDTIRVDDHDLGVAWMPSMDIDENGNPSVTYMAHDAAMTNPRYNVVHSTDQGLTYQAEMDITTTIAEEACDCCPAEYVIDGNQHALLYRNNDMNIRDIYAVYSEDDGLTYPESANVDQLNWSITSCPSTGPHGLFNNSKLITVYASRASGSYRVYLSETATAPNFAFENTTMMTPPLNTNGIQNYPRISGNNDTLVMVWQESETGNPEIFSAFTTTANTSEIISSKTMVNSSTSGSQTNPDVIYKNGKVHAVYQDALTGDVIYRQGTIGTVSLEENDLSQLTVYPNPTVDGTFAIDLNNMTNATFELRDALGNKCPFTVNQQNAKIQLGISNPNRGIYFLTVITENAQQTIKLINL
jgi:hypothetical protein